MKKIIFITMLCLSFVFTQERNNAKNLKLMMFPQAQLHLFKLS